MEEVREGLKAARTREVTLEQVVRAKDAEMGDLRKAYEVWREGVKDVGGISMGGGLGGFGKGRGS